MKPLQPSGWGIRVDKSKATETYPLRTTQPHHPKTVKENFKEQRERQQKERKDFIVTIEKIFAIVLFVLWCIVLFFL